MSSSPPSTRRTLLVWWWVLVSCAAFLGCLDETEDPRPGPARPELDSGVFDPGKQPSNSSGYGSGSGAGSGAGSGSYGSGAGDPRPGAPDAATPDGGTA